MAECKISTSIHWQAGSASHIIRRDLPEQYARGFVPELRRDCAQHAPAIVPHDIGRAILPAELAARFVVKDCARRMIPGEAAIEYREVFLPTHGSRIFLRSPQGNAHGYAVPFRGGLPFGPLFGGH